MRKLIALVFSALVATLLVGTAIGGPAQADSKTPCCGKSLWVYKQQGTSSNPSAAKVAGQVNIVTGNVANKNNAVIGTYTSVHTAISVQTNGSYEILNSTTYKLPQGTILTSGNETWTMNVASQQPTVQVVPIVGGTGLYAGVAGTSTNTPDPWPIRVQFKFTNR